MEGGDGMEWNGGGYLGPGNGIPPLDGMSLCSCDACEHQTPVTLLVQWDDYLYFYFLIYLFIYLSTHSFILHSFFFFFTIN